MGKELYCDFCRAGVPVESNMKPLIIGELKIGDACFTCASQFEQALKAKILETAQKYSNLKNAADIPAEQPADQGQPAEPVQETQSVAPAFQNETAK